MEWNKKIKEGLQDFEVSPPKQSWDAISKELKRNQGNTIQIGPNYATAASWIRYTAAAIVIGVIMLASFNGPFQNSIKDALQGPGSKATVVESKPSISNDSLTMKDSTKKQFPN
jgi:hypothetical protein